MDTFANQKNLGNVIGGHKANLKNPNTSEEAKEHSKEVLEEIGSETKSSSTSSGQANVEGKNPDYVIRGYKAAINNPNVSDEAKQRAEEKLEQLSSG